MGSVEGLYSSDHMYLGAETLLKDFHFLAVEEVHKLGVGVSDPCDSIELQVRRHSRVVTLIRLCEPFQSGWQ